MKFDQVYNRDEFLKFLEDFLPEDFTEREEDIVISKDRCKKIHKAQVLGESDSLGLSVLEVEHESENDPRVSIATDAFKILADHWIHKALVIFKSKNSDNYRLSLLTISLDLNEKNKTVRKYSNARRYSFYLGPGAKINTPTKYLLKSGRIIDFDDLKDQFSLEVVNKDFYKEISHLFAKLVGGSYGNGKNKKEYEPLLELPSVAPKSQTSLEFGVRLIGRVIFCWFLREKKSEAGTSLMPSELLSHSATKERKNYYHTILEPIFFEILNKSVKSRKDQFADDLFSLIPYLNGGLFSPQNDDYFSYNEGKQAIYHNTVKVPDEWIQEFFEFLETYNFTIDENISFDEELSIDPEMLGRIFENLLAEINPETGESARKSTGSYYTPRTIVDYMVDESIFAYLQNKTGIEEEKLRAVISYDLIDDQKYPLNDSEKEKVVSALSEVKILDPACGSGAFPIGALQKIVFILQQVDPNGQEWFKQQIKNTSPEIRRVIEREFQDKNFDYIRKLGVIRENIFGVDIQPIATEISRLRCFLTLVVDESVRDGEDNRGIEPLPNLDFKFVTANSLIGLPTDPTGELTTQGGLFEDRSGIEELQELRNMFFTASGTEREQIKLQFVQAQNRIFQRLIQSGSTKVAELTTRLTSWDPFSHQTSNWFDPEWMFGVRDGFNVVIANPPYVNLERFDVSTKEYLKKTSKVYAGKADVLYFFFEKGIELLKQEGNLVFVTSRYYLEATYAKKLRDYITNRCAIKKLIDFHALSVFEGVGIHALITVLQKGRNDANTFVAQMQTDDKYPDFYNSFKTFETTVSDSNWVLSSNKENELFRKVQKGSKILGDISTIEQGQKSGKNNAFVVSSQEAKSLEKEPLRKLIKNSHICKYVPNFTGAYLIYSDEEFDIEKYPNIKTHLLKFKEDLTKRAEARDGLYPWYRLQRPRSKNLFDSKEKIVVPYRAEFNKFAYDNQQLFNDGGDIRIIVLDNPDEVSYKYCVAILNSALMNYYFKFIGRKKGKMFEYFKDSIAKIPIKIASLDQQELLAEKVDQIRKLASEPGYSCKNAPKEQTEIEKEIDNLVYELYELTPEEIKIIESSS